MPADPLRIAVHTVAALSLTLAAVMPCPPSNLEERESGSVHVSHVHGSSDASGKVDSQRPGEGLAQLAAPCRCGCGERGASMISGNELGPTLLSRLEGIVPSVHPRPVLLSEVVPAPPVLSPPDPIPIS